RTSVYSDIHISLMGSPADGYFTVALTATDDAGNTNSGSYTFAMDSAPPSVTVENVIPEGPISPEEPIELTVYDAFLASVLLSLDEGTAEVLSAPYDIDLSLVSLGWHTIQITATDISGLITQLNQSIYVDGTSPTITTDIEENATANQAVEIRACVTDDFAVGTVAAYYENEHGAFSSMQMSMDGGSFVAMLDAQLLMDGMVVYVYASDLSGNSAESERVVLNVTNVPDEEEDDDPSGGAGMSSTQAAGVVGIVASIAALLYFIYDRRFRRKGVAVSPGGPDGTAAAPVPNETVTQEQPATVPEKPAEPEQSFIPKIMISETGVVYCKPIKVPADRIVRRPPIQRAPPTELKVQSKAERETTDRLRDDQSK
ncbi:MAG: hypothetical protein MUO87_07180, partial [Thermoplasmata archaeon]|nr:hypothetical protein [Thermoplasmata archaeon]